MLVLVVLLSSFHFARSVTPFKIGIVSSMTGAFTDWNSTLSGELVSKY